MICPSCGKDIKHGPTRDSILKVKAMLEKGQSIRVIKTELFKEGISISHTAIWKISKGEYKW